MRIVITNTAMLNTGDAAILFATVDILRQTFGPEVEFNVYDQQAATAARYYPNLRFRRVLADQLPQRAGWGGRKFQIVRLLVAASLWRTSLRAVGRWLAPRDLHASLDEFAAADMVVSAGGTYLVPHYRIFPKLIDLLVGLALRRPVVLFTQSLGPFPARRWGLLHFVLRRASAILVRDEQSRRHLVEYGIRPDHIAECADAAFALASPPFISRPPGAARRLRIAISVRDWPHIGPDQIDSMRRYLNAVAGTVRWLIEQCHADITFLSTCQGIAEYWTDDAAVAEEVVARLPPTLRDHIRVNHDFHDPKRLIALLKTFDLVIATRMHVAILALGAGVPVVPIAYEFKTVELFKRLGLGDLVHDIKTVTEVSLSTTIDGLLSGPADLPEKLSQFVERERSSAFSAGRHIRDAVGVAT